MRVSRRIFVGLSSVGLLLLGVLSHGQKAAFAASGLMASTEQVSKVKGDQGLKPATQTGKVRMTLKMASTPLKSGKNKLMLTITDAKGQPIAAKNVQVAMIMTAKEMDAMGMSGMGQASAKTQVKPIKNLGMFEVETSLPYGGNWELRVNLTDTQPPARAVFKLAVK
jgi:hypothetical protein